MNLERPARDETVEYYHHYIDLVPEGDIRRTLELQREETVSFLGTIPESLARHRYAPDKWSVAEVLCHLNDCERLYTMRAFWFGRGLESPLPSFESEQVVVTARPHHLPLADHVGEFADIRASTVRFFRNLPNDAWLRQGTASGYPFTVRALAWIAAGHVIHHLAVLRERYLTGT